MNIGVPQGTPLSSTLSLVAFQTIIGELNKINVCDSGSIKKWDVILDKMKRLTTPLVVTLAIQSDIASVFDVGNRCDINVHPNHKKKKWAFFHCFQLKSLTKVIS